MMGSSAGEGVDFSLMDDWLWLVFAGRRSGGTAVDDGDGPGGRVVGEGQVGSVPKAVQRNGTRLGGGSGAPRKAAGSGRKGGRVFDHWVGKRAAGRIGSLKDFRGGRAGVCPGLSALMGADIAYSPSNDGTEDLGVACTRFALPASPEVAASGHKDHGHDHSEDGRKSGGEQGPDYVDKTEPVD